MRWPRRHLRDAEPIACLNRAGSAESLLGEVHESLRRAAMCDYPQFAGTIAQCAPLKVWIAVR